MDGGTFQGANLPDWSDAVTFYTIPTGTGSAWYDITIDPATGSFRYLRFINANRLDVAEIEFYGVVSVPPVIVPPVIPAGAVVVSGNTATITLIQSVQVAFCRSGVPANGQRSFQKNTMTDAIAPN